MNYSKTKVIYYNSPEIVRDDILWGLIELGIKVDGSDIKADINYISEEQVEAISLEVSKYDYAITQDFSVNVAEACHRTGTPYISWIYDSPQIALFTDYALYSENYVFCFDKMLIKRLEEYGLKHIYYQPLAANIRKLDSIKTNASLISKYSADVSFVGQMYRTKPLNKLFSKMTSSEIDSFISLCGNLCFSWTAEDPIFNSVVYETSSFLQKYIPEKDYDIFHMAPSYSGVALFVCPFVTQFERSEIIYDAANLCNTVIYTRDSDVEYIKEYAGCEAHPPIKGDIPFIVYKSSSLNLNVTLRSIETGVPQRIFDITGSHGAVITNYQKEIEDLFEPDSDIIVFHSREEFTEKTRFYLDHPSELQRIKDNGYKHTKAEYNYSASLNKIFNCV